MKELTFRVVTNHLEAERVWKELSPNELLNDNWEFRYTFFKYQDCDLHFIAGYNKEKLIGLLPLQYNPAEEIIQSFSNRSGDHDLLYLKKGYKKYAEEFFKQVKQPAVISLGSVAHKCGTHRAESDADKFSLEVSEFTDYQDYIQKLWKPKNAKKITKEITTLTENNKVEIIYNDMDDIELLFSLNTARFPETSGFRLYGRRQAYRDFLKTMNVDLMTVLVNGEKKAVTVAILFNGQYFGLNNGTSRDVNNLGKYCYLLKIDRAIKLGMKSYGAGKKDYGGWKELFCMDRLPQYVLQLPGDYQ